MPWDKIALALAGALATGVLMTGAAQAQTDASVLAGTCANCHGTDGNSPGAIPSIAGLPFEYILEQLLAFKADEVPGTTIMGRIAKGYSDEELEALALHFSEIEE
ncbi:c-type cytochrome [Pelagibacterium luteolum]|nr:c-type cytochrome [Pelagibacterium luteolum]